MLPCSVSGSRGSTGLVMRRACCTVDCSRGGHFTLDLTLLLAGIVLVGGTPYRFPSSTRRRHASGSGASVWRSFSDVQSDCVAQVPIPIERNGQSVLKGNLTGDCGE